MGAGSGTGDSGLDGKRASERAPAGSTLPDSPSPSSPESRVPDPAPRKRRLGVIGTFVWDVIHGRDPRSAPVEEWGGITYSLAGLDAALGDGWEIVPVAKVGFDLAERARQYVHGLRHAAPDAAPLEVPYPNNRVILRYTDDERRTECSHGHVPGWTWPALKPVIDDARLDALYINFLSGWELDLPTAQALRAHFQGPIYCDLHMLMSAVNSDGMRVPRPLPDVADWCGCFDFLQVNEDEQAMMAPDGMSLAATAMAAGVSCLMVTLGKRGAVYFAAPGFADIGDLPPRAGIATAPRGGRSSLGAIRTALLPAEHARTLDGDPTGCGDVWGSTCFARLLAGDKLEDALRAAHHAAARNVEHRGASGLANHLRGELSRP